MSPIATGGPPHTRASSANGGGPVGTMNGTKINGIDGMKGANRVFAHLDDLVAAKPNVDINSPIRKILQEGELLAKQADTHLDFRRPDYALQEYVKASIVAVDIIPRHKDYPSLQSDRGELHRLYTGLNKRINAQHKKFAEVKDVIKENNARSGVLPTIGSNRSTIGYEANPKPSENGHARTQSVPSGPIINGTSINLAAPRKKAPPVQPKPDALHGKVINSATSSNNASPQADLAARFARLRSPDSNAAVQDPRIRTRPIPIPESGDGQTGPPAPPQSNHTTITRPAGPRELPSVPKALPRHTKVPLDIQIPTMPRAPDAIYHSPARGAENATTVNLPSSIVRTSSYLGNSRQDSAPPISTVGPTPDLSERRGSYFSFAHTASNGSQDQNQQKGNLPFLPDGTTVTAEELVKYLRQGSQSLRILIVDIRSRDEFDSGHIMSQSVICVEPITLRHGISGDQLADSMVIAPDFEQDLFEKRKDFDLVVFYDQSSKSIDMAPSFGKDSNSLLRDFSAAVYDYGYEKRVKQRPMLLVGGIDAWVDLLGPSSLKTSKTSTVGTIKQNGVKPARPLGRVAMGRDPRNTALTRTKTRSSRPLTKEEESKWDMSLREQPPMSSPASDDQSPSEDLYYARTTEDFFRRYPELPSIQESMVSPVPPLPPTQIHQEELVSTIPRLPTRPAPALPRQRSSGISERGPTTTYTHTGGNGASITTLVVPPGLTGLRNIGNLCYMHAALQGISATPFLRNLLKNYQFPPMTPIPRKSNELSDPPQLMVRVFGNLLGHLWGGQYDNVTPTTFSRYLNSVHARDSSSDRTSAGSYGGSRQHDSSEFLLYLLDILDDELNPKRNIDERALPEIPPKLEHLSSTLPMLQASLKLWEFQMRGQASPITTEMKSLQLTVITCISCNYKVQRPQPTTILSVRLPPSTTVPHDLSRIMSAVWGPVGEIPTYTCPKCNQQGKAHTTDYLARLPNYLVISLARDVGNASGQKNITPVYFNEKGIDMAPYFVPDLGSNNYEGMGREHRAPFLYDVYAVTHHSGADIRSGHYWTYSKSLDLPNHPGTAGGWHRFNDEKVTPAAFSETQGAGTAVIYLRRQGS